MARIRTIKPEFFISETLAVLDLSTERSFSGLMTQVDDCGRYKDNPAIINGALWPLRPEHTAADMEADLTALDDAELLCRYEDGGRWLHILNWDEHQVVNKPTASKIPPCPSHGTSKYDSAKTIASHAAKTPVKAAAVPVGAPSNAEHMNADGSLQGVLEVVDSLGQRGPQSLEGRAEDRGFVGSAEHSGSTPVGLPEPSGRVPSDLFLASPQETPVGLREGSGSPTGVTLSDTLNTPERDMNVQVTALTEGTPVGLRDCSGRTPGGLREDYRGERKGMERKGKELKNPATRSTAFTLAFAPDTLTPTRPTTASRSLGSPSCLPSLDPSHPAKTTDRNTPSLLLASPQGPGSNDEEDRPTSHSVVATLVVPSNGHLVPQQRTHRAAPVSATPRPAQSAPALSTPQPAPEPTSAPTPEDPDMGIYDEAVDAFAMPAVTKTTESFTALNNGVGGASMAEQMKVMSEQMEKLQTDQPKPKPVRKKVSKLRSNKVTGLRNPVTPEEIALYHPDAFVISNHLYASVRKNLEQHVGVTAAKNVHVTEDWLHQGELLLVTDGIEASRVLTLIDWVAQDGFWRTNIRGMAKLRLQSERLLMDPGFLRWAVANNRTILNPAVATAEVAQGSGRPQGRVRAVALDTSKVLYSESI